MLFNIKYTLSRVISPALLNQQQQGGMPAWAWFLLIVAIIVFFVLLWRWLGLLKGGEQPAKLDTASVSESKPVTTAAPAPADAESALVEKSQVVAPEESIRIAKKPKADDLTLIEGIGPKIAIVLQGVGIKTFAQLANTEVAMLDATLKAANLRLADPESWPEQAKLAADGKLDELKTLQDNLKGGRRA